MPLDFNKLSLFWRFVVVYIAIIGITLLIWGILKMASGFPQDLRDAFLVMIGALFGNLIWEVLKKGLSPNIN
jgi:Trk-type K+ transport system membrane component